MPHVVSFSWTPLKAGSKESDASKKLTELYKQIPSQKGHVSSFFGHVLEAPSSVEGIAEFESVEAYEAFRGSSLSSELKTLKAEVTDTSNPMIKPNEDYAVMTGPLAQVADRGVTCLVALAYKADEVDAAAVEATAAKVCADVAALGLPGFHGEIQGWTNKMTPEYRRRGASGGPEGDSLGAAKIFGTLSGWDSKEAADEGNKKIKPIVDASLKKLPGYLDVVVAHIPFKKIE